MHFSAVAPHRGERGLKCDIVVIVEGRAGVAPHRGERGLKSMNKAEKQVVERSLPIVGSVD